MVLVAVLACGIVVVQNIFSQSTQVLGWGVAAAVVAMLLSPVMQGLDRRLPRPLAILATFVMVLVLSGGIAWIYTSTLLDEVEQLQESGPAAATQIEERDDQLGQIARDIDLTDRVTELTDRLDERTGSGSDVIRSAALSVPPYFVSMILTIFLLLFGQRMIQGGLDQLSEEHRARLRPALGEATRRTQIAVWASVAQAVVSGFAIWLVGSWLGVPAVALVALFGATAGLLPYVGIGVGWIPVLVLGVGVGSASDLEVALAAICAVVLQGVEWRYWRPFADGRSLHVGPAVPVIVAILGFGIYGLGGALYGCVIAVLALALADQLTRDADDLPTPLDEPDPKPTPEPEPEPESAEASASVG